MSDPFDLAQLQTLVAIAETGGFRRAGETLHLSQPTVSQHVRLLEKRLRKTLVEKDGRGSRFTPDGERLVVEARLLLAAHNDMLERLDARDPGTLTIGSTEHTGDLLLPELLVALRAAYPELRIQFRLDRSTALKAAVDKGSLDLAVVLGADPRDAGAEVGRLPLRWVASADWTGPDARHGIPLAAFEEPCGIRERATRLLTEAGHRVVIAAESPNLSGVLAAVRAGFAVALLPIGGEIPRGLVEVSDLPPTGNVDLRIVTRRGLNQDTVAVALDAVTTFFGSQHRLIAAVDERTRRQLKGVA